MARTGHRSRKRKFQGNQHTQRSTKSQKIEDVAISIKATTVGNQSASERKIGPKLEAKGDKEEQTGSSNLTGYRLMDMEILANEFSLIYCQECGEQNIQLSEISFRRHGCPSCLRLLCLSCGWNHCFYSSKRFLDSMRLTEETIEEKTKDIEKAIEFGNAEIEGLKKKDKENEEKIKELEDKLLYQEVCNRPFPHSNKQLHRVEARVDKNTTNV